MAVALVAAGEVFAAEPAKVLVAKEGAEKLTVSVDVKGNAAFAAGLKRNLVLSGNFLLVARGGAVQVTDGANGGVRAVCRGKALHDKRDALKKKALKRDMERGDV